MLAGHKFLKIISLKLKKLFVLTVVNNQHFVNLLFYLLLEVHIVISSEHKILTEVSWQDDVHDVNLLDDDTVWFELGLKLCHHLTCKLGLDISNSAYLDLLGEVSDLFIHFFLEKLLKSVWSEVVEELFGVFVFGGFGETDVEIDTNIH